MRYSFKCFTLLLVLIVLCGRFDSQATGNALSQIHAGEAWKVNTDCSKVLIGVIDNGIDVTHPDLAANIYKNPGETPDDGIDNEGNGFIDDIYGWDFYRNSNNPQPDQGDPYIWHGTFTAGIIAARGINGARGLCWTAKIIPLKKHLADYYQDNSVIGQVVAALNYAVDFKIRETARQGHNVPMVINNSYLLLVGLQGWNAHPELKEAIDNASENGIGMFFAATNSGRSNDDPASAAYPASYNNPNVIQVAAVDGADHLSRVTNYGSVAQIAAPAVNIMGLRNAGGYAWDVAGRLGYTSFATPYVTAAAALYWSLHPDYTFAQIRSALLGSADKIAGLNVQNGNRLNVGRLLTTSSGVPATGEGKR